MGWLMWLALVVAIVAVFILWDLVFCGGRRCAQLVDRLPDRLRPGDLTRLGSRDRTPAKGPRR